MADRLQIDDPAGLLRAFMREDFRAFLRKAYPSIRGGEPLLWNWHLDAIAYQLARIEAGHTQRPMVTMPPRNLKSITISVAWVAWMLGRDPRRNFVCVSYSNELSAKLARDCRTLMQTAWYRELFPHTALSSGRSASVDFETAMGGGRLATSITGTLTGRGGDIIIIDDPIKPEEANSDTTREAVNQWLQSTLASRLNDKASGSIVTVMQRLHQYGLAGTLLEAGGWDQLSLPAIALRDEVIPTDSKRTHIRKEGDVLHPERESLAVLDQVKASMGSMLFAAQYQQDPVPAAGNMIKAEWLLSYPPTFEAVPPGQIVQSWDAGASTTISRSASPRMFTVARSASSTCFAGDWHFRSQAARHSSGAGIQGAGAVDRGPSSGVSSSSRLFGRNSRPACLCPSRASPRATRSLAWLVPPGRLKPGS